MKSKYYKLVFFYLSLFIIIIGCLQLLPLTMLIFYPSEINEASYFIIPGVVSILLGYIINYFTNDAEQIKLENNYDAVLVVLIWLCAIFISAFPWMLTGNYNFTQAMFEMTSGFSTTGLSVITPDETSHMFLFFRSISLFVGGVGFILILTCTLSDRYGLNLYNTEGHTDRLLPNLARSARLILTIYSCYIVLGTVAYLLAGMNMFDAFNTSIAALSTGGFATIGASIYGYHSLTIEIITIVLMMLGGTNFMIHYSLIKGKFKAYSNHCETKFLYSLFILFIPVMVISLLKAGYSSSIFESLRISIFQFFSCITTTGFQSVDSLNVLPNIFCFAMIMLMLVGGNYESTAGGIKQYRVIVALKGIYYSIKESISNFRSVNPHYITKFNEKENLSSQEIQANTTYILFYLLLFFFGSAIFTTSGNNLQEAMLEFSSALSTVGLSVGITGYNASNLILWTGIVGMFFGRLEIMVIFKAILRTTKDLRK